MTSTPRPNVAIHQPEHLPWLGFFHKLYHADVFVLLDQVQYRKNYFHNRNRIRAAGGPVWLTVPVLTRGRHPQSILDATIDDRDGGRWRQKHWRTIAEAYGKHPFFAACASLFQDIYARPWARLVELNEALIEAIRGLLGIGTEVLRASALGVGGQREDLLLHICEKLGARGYLSGVSGRDYLDPARWAAAGVELSFQEFHHPIYPQRQGGFLPCMSTLDLLFSHGPRSLDMIRGIDVPVMDQVFE